jgi:hypothetical protein
MRLIHSILDLLSAAYAQTAANSNRAFASRAFHSTANESSTDSANGPHIRRTDFNQRAA